MTFISFAQNFEDVMLWRALKHVDGGFYIDVGAAWPDVHSVTKAFYDKDWHGINIEPNPQLHQQLIEDRPRDINLQLAVSDSPGVLSINIFEGTGLSTINDQIAEMHHKTGFDVERQEVQVVTLAGIWESHVPEGQDVHFLKVDVEGLEAAVLHGNDWDKYRPWIVVVEATLPMSQTETYTEWEPILLQARYQFAYADGLNRFYVATERAELMQAFKYPPNVFDGFMLVGQQQAESRAQQAEVLVQQAQAQMQRAEASAQQAESRAQQAEQLQANYERRLKDLFNSRSWRITAPLRWGSNQVRLLRAHGFKARGKVFIKKLLKKSISVINMTPWVRTRAIALARRLGIEQRLRRIYYGGDADVVAAQVVSTPSSIVDSGASVIASRVVSTSGSLVDSTDTLTPHARKIYYDLVFAIEQNRQKRER